MMPAPASPIPADAVSDGRQASARGAARVPAIMPPYQAEPSTANPRLPVRSTSRAKKTSATPIMKTLRLVIPTDAMSPASARSRSTYLSAPVVATGAPSAGAVVTVSALAGRVRPSTPKQVPASTNDAASTPSAAEASPAAHSAPPVSGPAVQPTQSAVRVSEFAQVSRSGPTRLGVTARKAG